MSRLIVGSQAVFGAIDGEWDQSVTIEGRDQIN